MRSVSRTEADDTMPFRSSAYIDFETGHVLVQPMELLRNRQAPQSIDDMFDLFECRVDVWQLGPAVEILKEIESNASFGPSVWAHSAYALLAVVSTYFEMIGKTLNPSSEPSRTAGLDFNHGFCDVYPMFAGSVTERSDQALPEVREFRDRLRNGLFHLGYTKANLLIHNEPRDRVPADFFVDKNCAPPRYLVNPHELTRTVVAHLPSFMARLRSGTPETNDLQTRFRRFFTEFHGLQ